MIAKCRCAGLNYLEELECILVCIQCKQAWKVHILRVDAHVLRYILENTVAFYTVLFIHRMYPNTMYLHLHYILELPKVKLLGKIIQCILRDESILEFH